MLWQLFTKQSTVIILKSRRRDDSVDFTPGFPDRAFRKIGSKDLLQACLPDLVQGEIGIRNKRHCTDIVKHLADLEMPSQNQEEAERRKRNKVTLCVEGNISAGKSTFLQKLLKSSVELRDIIEVLSTLSPQGLLKRLRISVHFSAPEMYKTWGHDEVVSVVLPASKCPAATT